LYTPFEVDTINVVSEAAATQVVSVAKHKVINFHIVVTIDVSKVAGFRITFLKSVGS
jgi:hypothetical protein